VLANLLVGDRGFGHASGRLAGEHGAGLGDRLDARGGVDKIARDHSLPLGAERHGGLACQDAGPGFEVRRLELVSERRDGRDQIEGRAHGALGVVLLRHGRSPDRHHRVADELLHRAAVERDQALAAVEVAREELAHLLGVARLGERGKADQVGEEDGDQAALGRWSGRWSRGGRNGLRLERGSALVAELLAGVVGRPARRTPGSEGRAALATELRVDSVVSPATGTGHVAFVLTLNYRLLG
jgi:hypothetical protein